MKSIKNIKYKIKNCLLLFSVLFALSCSNWLDGALPKDKNLADQQFSTERNIHSVLNGIYWALADGNLYGSKLTMTEIELLAHYYYFNPNITQSLYSGYEHFLYMSNYNWTDTDIKNSLAGIWSKAYKTIFEINNFIERLDESTVISDEKKNVFLGEAYGLRAFLHFDLFRLFGSEAQDIPYNQSAEVIPHPPIPAEEFYDLLLEDIDKALLLLKNDPILTIGIKDLTSDDAAETSTADIFTSYLRNYRMNYYAVQALKARILMYKGDVQEAGNLALNIITTAFGDYKVDGKPFYWADKTKIEEEENRNYIFYEEVIFGIHNSNLYSRWKNYTGGTAYGNTYAVHLNNLQGNIFKNDNVSGSSISLWEDVRSKQWILSAIGGLQYVSCKYAEFPISTNNPKQYFQPLIRVAELYYIVAEARIRNGRVSDAIGWLNNFRVQRGMQYESLPTPESVSELLAYSILETEYYKEFYGEGQAYFYLKRQKSNTVFNVESANTYNQLPANAFIIPLPDDELDN